MWLTASRQKLVSGETAQVATSVTVPLWLAVLVGVLAAVALIDRLFAPALRWWLRRRVNRAIDELNRRLKVAIPPFKLARRRQLIEQLMFDPEVLKAVDDEAKAKGEPKSITHARARRYAKEIVPAFSAYAYFRVGAGLAKWLSTALYRVRVGAFEEAELYRVPPDASVVFVINHRSNMDYVLVTYLVSESSALSYAVGEWARVWALQRLIRAMGGYFVRRDSSNPLYRKVLARYVHMATASGVTQAVFPEGGLTRDGRLRPPKLGLLSYMVSGFDPQRRPRHRVRAGRHQLRPRAGGPRPHRRGVHARRRAPALRLQSAGAVGVDRQGPVAAGPGHLASLRLRLRQLRPAPVAARLAGRARHRRAHAPRGAAASPRSSGWGSG